jgi:HEAT repeat protein
MRKALRTIDPLRAALNDEDKDVRANAAKSIGILVHLRVETFHSEIQQIVESLISALKDEDQNVRVAAAESLAWLQDSRAVELLIEALTDEDDKFRSLIEKVLFDITSKSFYGNQKKWQEWWEKNKEKYIRKK